MKKKSQKRKESILILVCLSLCLVIFTACQKKQVVELESYQEPTIKIEDLPKETTTEPPTEATTEPETTTEAPTEPPTEPPRIIRVVFDDSGADSTTFKVQTFEERVEGQSFVGEISKDGFTFGGWSLTKDATEASYSANSGVSDEWIREMSDQYGDSVMLYAVWVGPKYRALTPGEVSEEVVAMQQALTTLGYYTIGIDGSYGPGTEWAVSAFRIANGLSEDGTADSEMLDILFQQAPQEPVPEE